MKKTLFILSTFALLLAACGSSVPEPITVNIDMSEFAYSPSDIELRVGQEVTFILENVGALEHELMIGREVTTHDGELDGYHTDFFEAGGVEPIIAAHVDDHDDDMDAEEMEDMDAGHDEHEGFMALMGPGQETTTISFTVTEGMLGDWEIGCFLQDGVHYTAGMLGSLTVIE